MAATDGGISIVPYGSLDQEELEGVSIEEAVEQSGFGWFQIRLLLISSLLLASDAMEILLLSVLAPELRCEWRLEEYQVASITTLVFLGMFFGSSICGWITDIFGRRAVLILLCWWISYFGIATAFSPTIWWVYILRLLVGFALAGSLLSFQVLVEYVPKLHRGKTASFSLFAWPIGVVLQSVFAILIVPTYGWRALVIASTIPMILCSILFTIYMPESPSYLLISGQAQEARRWIQVMARVNGRDFDEKISSKTQEEQTGSIRDLLNSRYLRTSMILFWLWFASGFIYYGNVLLSADSEKLQSSCLKVDGGDEHNATTEKYECGLHCRGLSDDDYKNILFTSLGELFGPILVLLLVDLFGRRTSLVIVTSLASLGYFLMQFCLSALLFRVLSLATRALCSATFTMVMLYTTEVFPTSVRGVSFGVGNSMARLGAMITPFISQVLAAVNPAASIYVYVTIAALSAILSFFLHIETKGRSMKQTLSEDVE